jgi:toxin-antitoxin system PIN domain toxin
MIFLLDTNVLIALATPAHPHHLKALDWFAEKGSLGWATCPITQAGFVRIMSNPAASPYALSVDQAIQLLQSNMQHPHHHQWTDEIMLPDAAGLLKARLTGHQQVTDLYLLALAFHKKGRLATLDGSIASILPSESRFLDRVEAIN